VTPSVTFNGQKNSESVDEMENSNANVIIHKAMPCTPDEVLEEIFQKMEVLPTTKELNCENSDTVTMIMT
jgi:hypothetical protein